MCALKLNVVFTMPIFSKLAMLNGITFGPCIQNFTQIAQEMREVRVEIHTCRQ